MRSLNKNVVERSINILSKQEYDDVWIECGEIMNASIITKGDDAIDYSWNVYNSQKFTNRKCGKFTNRFISEDDIKEMISRKAYKEIKEKFPEKKRKIM